MIFTCPISRHFSSTVICLNPRAHPILHAQVIHGPPAPNGLPPFTTLTASNDVKIVVYNLYLASISVLDRWGIRQFSRPPQ